MAFNGTELAPARWPVLNCPHLLRSVEYAATIIDANAQKKWQLTPEQVEELKTPAALYAKALGMQSLTSRIEQYIRDPAKRM